MTNANIREAHRIITNAGSVMTRDQIDLLRSVLPPLPKQKTLEEITEHVYDAWVGTNGNEWPDDVHGGLETWLAELHTQLQGLKDTPATVPALPTGMRIADHEDYGRVVVSPAMGKSENFLIFFLEGGYSEGANCTFEHYSNLTFIDSEPAEPAHPEFLDTEADYENAPEDTIVACAGSLPCHKFYSKWSSFDFCEMKDDKGMSRARRRVLRWGYGE